MHGTVGVARVPAQLAASELSRQNPTLHHHVHAQAGHVCRTSTLLAYLERPASAHLKRALIERLTRVSTRGEGRATVRTGIAGIPALAVSPR